MESRSEPVGSPQLQVSLEQVSKIFGTFFALRNLSGSFESGNIYAVLGENGAGKSTLLRLLAGLNRKTSGTIAWTAAGRSVKPSSLQSRTGYMAHSSMLYDELSALENLQYFASLYEVGAGSAARWSGPDRALQSVGLDPGLKRPIGQYSQGMRQRVSLARAVLHDPQIVLLDEPFSNIDAQSAQRMAALIGEMRDARKLVMLTTHQPSLVKDIADEYIDMSAGTIVNRRRCGDREGAVH